jgi:hypothetical protein
MKIFLIAALLLQLTRPQSAAVRAFKKQTGYPNGRPGFVVDHIIPLCAGGPDTVANLQWQDVKGSYQKDIYERALCAALKKQGYRVMKVQP